MFLCAQVKPFTECTKRWDKAAKRCHDNIVGMSCLTFDLDNKAPLPVIHPEFFIRGYLRHQAISASSASSQVDYPRGRVVVPLTREVTIEEYKRLVRAFVAGLSAAHPELAMDEVTALDPTTDQPNRAYYLPQTPTTGAAPFIVSAPELPVLDPDKVLKTIPELRKPSKKPPTLNIAVDDALLDYVIKCLYSFDPTDETDRWQTANSIANTFVDEDDPTLNHRAREAWIAWATRAPGYCEERANVKWEDAQRRGYTVPIGMIIRKIPAKKRAANEQTLKDQLKAGGFFAALS
jgi:hypothetical protein